MTKEEASDILQRHNLWRRGDDNIEATDPKLLGMAIDKVIEVLRLSDIEQKEQLVNFLIYLNDKNLINIYDFDYEKEAKKYLKKCI